MTFPFGKKEDGGIPQKTVESSDAVTAAFGDYLCGKLGLSAAIIVGYSKDGEIAYSVQGTDSELAGLIHALLQMAPPTVMKEMMRIQLDVSIFGD